MENVFSKTTSISEGTIHSTAKSPYAMQILIFLNDSNSAFTREDIANELDMWWNTVDYNIQGLLKSLFVKIVEDRKSGRKYFQIAEEKEAIEKAIACQKRWVGFQLARLVPYKRIFAEQLKSDSRFVEACQNRFHITVNQGIQALRMCPKIGSEYNSNRLILWRKEQGYDSPEKLKEPERLELKKEEVEEVE